MKVNPRELFYTIFTLFWLTVFVFALNIFILGPSLAVTSYRGESDVKSVSVCQDEQPHFVTTKQKAEILALLNEGDLVDRQAKVIKDSPLPFKSLFLHRYKDKALEVVPFGKINDKLVVVVHDGQKETLLVEKSAGELQKVITQVFEERHVENDKLASNGVTSPLGFN